MGLHLLACMERLRLLQRPLLDAQQHGAVADQEGPVLRRPARPPRVVHHVPGPLLARLVRVDGVPQVPERRVAHALPHEHERVQDVQGQGPRPVHRLRGRVLQAVGRVGRLRHGHRGLRKRQAVPHAQRVERLPRAGAGRAALQVHR